eukprot:712146-Alexandrium_andersonii.AAC.1
MRRSRQCKLGRGLCTGSAVRTDSPRGQGWTHSRDGRPRAPMSYAGLGKTLLRRPSMPALR